MLFEDSLDNCTSNPQKEYCNNSCCTLSYIKVCLNEFLKSKFESKFNGNFLQYLGFFPFLKDSKRKAR